MATRNIEERAAELRSGRIGFPAYMAALRGEYGRMAGMLVRRWAPPAWVDREDVVQDMFAATWSNIWEFDPERGPSIGSFVVYTSVSDAKRRLHKARGAILHGSPDRNVSRIEMPMSAMGRQHGTKAGGIGSTVETLEEVMGRVMRLVETEEAVIAAADEAARVRRVLAACRSDLEQRIVVAYARAAGDDDGAAASLVADPVFRRETGIAPHEGQVLVRYARGVADEVYGRAEHA